MIDESIGLDSTLLRRLAREERPRRQPRPTPLSSGRDPRAERGDTLIAS